jgi:probable F420-dependent oxidoreductase
MRLAIRLPYYLGDGAGEAMCAVARAAERGGFHSGWVADHVVFPAGESLTKTNMTATGAYPRPYDEPTLESLTSLAYVAGATESLRLGVGVCVIPYRNPLLTAKVLASLDVLSSGRLIFGVGMGWLREEFEALGVPFAGRREALVEAVELMRACWEGSPVTYSGKHYSTPPVHFAPRPRGRIPIVFGGHAEPAIRRAAELGDGWIGHELSPARCAEVRATLREAAGGRPADDFTFVTSRLFNVPGTGPREEGRFDIDSRERLGELLAEYDQAGVDLLLCETTVRTGEALESLIEEVMAAADGRGMLHAPAEV